MKLLRYFAERRLVANLMTLVIFLLGLSSLSTIKRDSFPDVNFGEVLISTTYPGASPEDVELKVTNEIEDELREVVGLKDYQSWSMENVSMIHIRIDPDEDEDTVVRDIRDAVNRVTELPQEVQESPLVSELGTSAFPMLEVAITGEVPYRELKEVAKQIEKKLESIPGVAKVERFGYKAREIRVEVSPERMHKFQHSLRDIVAAIQRRNVQSTGGSFESYTSEKNIVTLAEFRSPVEVGDVIVSSTFGGPLIKIKDLAVVRDGYEEEKILSRVNGISAISFIAYKQTSADIIRTVEKIKMMLDVESQKLPESVDVSVSNDQSVYVEKRFEIVVINGLMGLALVLLVLSISLNIHIAFWVALGIPVSLFGAIFLLPMFDSFLDSVTLTAMVLVIGIVVDDAIIIAEQVYQKYEEGFSPIDAAVQGVNEVIKPVLTTMLTTVCAFTPLFFMPGMLSGFVFVLPLVVVLALCVSLAESSLALPAHLTSGLKTRRQTNSVPFKQKVYAGAQAVFKSLILKILKGRYVLILTFVALLSGVLYYAVTQMEFVLFPSSSADRFVIHIETPEGSSLNYTSEKASLVEGIVSELEANELVSFITRVGTFGELGSSERENNAAVFVALTPFATRERSADEIVESLRKRTDRLEGVGRIRYTIDAGGPPVGRPITVKAVGGDDATRKRLAKDILAFLESLPGTKDLDRDDKPGKQQVEIKLDYANLARLGMTVADVAQNVRIAYDGEVATSVRYGDEDVDFRVIYNDEVRKEPKYLEQLWLPNRNNRLSPLAQVASFEPSQGPANFYHFKGDRAITITGDIDTEVTTPLQVAEAVKDHFALYQDYPGMQLEVGGEAEETQQSLNELFTIMGIAAIGIYGLLILLFNSVWQPLLVMIALPFGIIGVIVGFAFHGEVFGFLALTGMIGLAGVVVNDSLVLINHINELRKAEPNEDVRTLIALGASNRLRPIVLTTASTVAGLLPLAYGLGGADPYMGPMALALGWGLLFATPLTLILLPCLYLVGHDFHRLFDFVISTTVLEK